MKTEINCTSVNLESIIKFNIIENLKIESFLNLGKCVTSDKGQSICCM